MNSPGTPGILGYEQVVQSVARWPELVASPDSIALRLAFELQSQAVDTVGSTCLQALHFPLKQLVRPVLIMGLTRPRASALVLLDEVA